MVWVHGVEKFVIKPLCGQCALDDRARVKDCRDCSLDEYIAYLVHRE